MQNNTKNVLVLIIPIGLNTWHIRLQLLISMGELLKLYKPKLEVHNIRQPKKWV